MGRRASPRGDAGLSALPIARWIVELPSARDADRRFTVGRPVSRREFTKASLAASAAAWIGPLQSRAPAAPQGAASSPAQDAMEEALALLEGTGMEYRGGLANHGPMAAEAIATLHRPEAVVPWVERYKRALEPAAKASTPIDPARWREALGDPTRLAARAPEFDPRGAGEPGRRA